MRQRNPMLLVPLFAAAAAIVYLMLVAPCGDGLRKDRAALLKLRGDVTKRTMDIKNRSAVEERIAKTESDIEDFSRLQLQPLLESYAMRAKSIVGGFAAQAGLLDVEFSERPARALPVLAGRPVPAALHARRPVLISCYGDYAAIVSFILRVEKELPHVALGGLRIQPGGGQDPEIQRAEIVLEWPAKGAEKPNPAQTGAAKKK